MNDVMALSWFDHRRTRELCGGLDIELVPLATPYGGLRRYLVLTVRTVALLARRRPRVLLVQNPSLVLSVLAVALRGALRYRLVVDAHNEAVDPYENRQFCIGALSRWVVRRADLTIVTNRQLAQRVREQRGEPFILPDRIPAAPGGAARTLASGYNVVLIATFAKDEPISAIFDAVRGVQLHLHVTGNPARLPARVKAAAPANVHFTGFLAEGDYWSLLRSADAIVDLTLKPDCLVCGAYEALALGKPVLLSANAASIELFGDGALYTDNSPGDVRRALDQLRAEQRPQQAAAARKRDELIERWKTSAQALRAALAPVHPSVHRSRPLDAAPEAESRERSP
ncbi:MAG TPA: glycosyltransferase [Steroidobacteraceae bacterium]|nr:glycosyltransferase [Steroidobacteraceae bacterium]